MNSMQHNITAVIGNTGVGKTTFLKGYSLNKKAQWMDCNKQNNQIVSAKADLLILDDVTDFIWVLMLSTCVFPVEVVFASNSITESDLEQYPFIKIITITKK
jgi:ABC-type phosphate transport system ATPase subunit